MIYTMASIFSLCGHPIRKGAHLYTVDGNQGPVWILADHLGRCMWSNHFKRWMVLDEECGSSWMRVIRQDGAKDVSGDEISIEIQDRLPSHIKAILQLKEEELAFVREEKR